MNFKSFQQFSTVELGLVLKLQIFYPLTVTILLLTFSIGRDLYPFKKEILVLIQISTIYIYWIILRLKEPLLLNSCRHVNKRMNSENSWNWFPLASIFTLLWTSLKNYLRIWYDDSVGSYKRRCNILKKI